MTLTQNLEEIAAIIEAIEDRRGPILILVSSEGVCQAVQQIISNSDNGGMTRVESNVNNLQSHIDVFRANQARRLFIVFSKLYTPADPGLTIPDNFIRCEITCCLDSTALFDHKTSFCGVPFPAWQTRNDTVYPRHDLIPCQGVALDIPPVLDSPAAVDIQFIVNTFQEEITRAVVAGIRNGTVAQIIHFAVLIISHVRITKEGLYISARSCATVASRMAAFAFVYFISWETIAQSLLTAWDWVVSLLTRLWEFIKTSLDQIFSAIRRLVSKLFGGSGGAGAASQPECVSMKALKTL